MFSAKYCPSGPGYLVNLVNWYEGANLWNKLPDEYRKADSYKLFKKQISDTDLAGRYMS